MFGGRIGITELLLIAFVLLLLFGAKRIPEIFRAMGGGVKEFKKGLYEPEAPIPSKDEVTEKANKIEKG